MKKKFALLIAIALLLTLTGNVLAATTFKNFKMTFTKKDSYTSIVSDTTSKAKTTSDYATMIITSSSSSKNCKYYIYKGSSVISRDHFETTTKGTWFFYTSDVAKGTRITLKGRPDSSVSTCTITGSFGAG